jgi:DNA polymerase-3 subunit alpha
MRQNNFIHLHVHSAYSLAEGAIPVKKLINMCRDYGMPACAITDTANLFGAMEFALEAAKNGIQPILGSQIRFGVEGHEIVLLVQSEEGYRNICRIISASFLEVDPSHQAHTNFRKLAEHAEGLICLTGGSEGPVAQALLHHETEKAENLLDRFKQIYGDRLYIELQRHGLPQEDGIENELVDLAYKHEIPLVATNNCYFVKRGMHEAHDALLCIAEGRYIAEEDRRKVTPDHYFKTPREMRELFSDIPEAVSNTVQIARRCHYLLQAIDPILPPFETESGCSEIEELREQVKKGLEWRLENFVFTKGIDEKEKEEIAGPYRERMDYELGVIEQMGFPGYFLICSDFIKWAKKRNIPVGPGRGSGAGSVVAWALQITDLDPLRFKLLFERFLNPERVSMPDFDVDFCQDRREEVIQYVQGRYGHGKVAQIITFGKLQARAVVRDVGRVLQMPYGQVDRITKMIPNNPAKPVTLEQALEQDPDLRAERRKDDTVDKLLSIALQLEGLYRHASTHAAGLVIGDRELDRLVPLYRDPRSEMPVTQFNMKYVEQAGLVKFDFLGLKTMTVIQKAIDLIKENTGKEIDYLQIPFDDARTYELLTEGKTTGVFQLESSGMRDTLRKMKPDRLEDIIALVALYRPGPMDNIPLYIDCKEGRQEPDFPHPKLKPYLEETYGIMIYQEQVMQCAQVLAGYTLGEADILRRAMGKKIHEVMDAERLKFVKGAAELNNIDEHKANEIYDLLAKFADYGFNKSHAAAYAVIAYWTAWLKANYPLEFMAASMTLDMHNTDKLSVFKEDLQHMGIELLSPDINNSYSEFKVENEAIRYALAAIKGVGSQAMVNLCRERGENGYFESMESFAGRLDARVMNRRQLEKLVCAGAFDSINHNRASIFAGIDSLLAYAHTLAEERESGQSSLFGEESGGYVSSFSLPDVPSWDPLEQLQKEFEAIGFYISAHPLDTKSGQLKRLGIMNLAEVERELSEHNALLFKMAGVLIKKQEKVSNRTGNRYAFLQISDPTGVFEVTLFSEILAQTRNFLEPGNTLLIKVTAEQREDQIRYTAQSIEILDETLEKSLQEVRIHLNGIGAANKLKALLQNEGEGAIKVSFLIDMGEEEIVELALPGRWSFSSAARNAIRWHEEVFDLQEI